MAFPRFTGASKAGSSAGREKAVETHGYGSSAAWPGGLGNRAIARLLGRQRVQTASRDERSTDGLEQEADRAAEAVAGGSRPSVGMRAASANLLVEDGSETSAPGQMEKSPFLAALRAAVCRTADEALAPLGLDSQGCPWIENWFDYYASKDAAHVERALRKFAPEATAAATARDYIAATAARVRLGVERYAKTGELPELPDEAAAGPAGGVQLQRRDGRSLASAADPSAVQARLGSGRPLDGHLRSRMESAFGASFSNVRIHTDAGAASISDELRARAFTVGPHVAFGSGEYDPNTIVGQALVAHELAHVLQQRGAPPSAGAGHEHESSLLEQDADRSVEGALLSPRGFAAAKTAARFRTGLRLQRCSKDSSQKAPAKDPKLLADFAAKFPDAAGHVRKSPEGVKLVVEAQAAGVEFGGYSEDGPAPDTWPYTVGNKVYIPRARTDAVVAMSDFLFELNNAVRAPTFAALATEARKGSTGTLTARTYARKVVEGEVEGMLRLGKVWFETKKALGGSEWDKYDGDFYLAEYEDFKANRKTKDDIINDVLRRVYKEGVNRGKTVEQNYMEQYTNLSGGK